MERGDLFTDSGHEPLPFETALSRLKSIVEQLERDELPLESALNAYEEGVGMARRCLEKLQQAELRIQELSMD